MQAPLDDGVSDGLCTVTFAAARRAEEQGIFALSDPVGCGQFEDQVAIHAGVELGVIVIEGLVRIGELRLLMASLQEPLTRSRYWLSSRMSGSTCRRVRGGPVGCAPDSGVRTDTRGRATPAPPHRHLPKPRCHIA